MIDKIEMYKVGFGDCFICSDKQEDNKMLVDYGNINNRFLPCVVDAVNRSLHCSDTNYMMVTHFHNDHFSGLINLDRNLQFDTIYLPNFFTKNIIKLEFATLASDLKRGDDSFRIAYNLLTSIPTIARHFIHGTQVIFLNRSNEDRKEYIHSNGLDNLRILWPDMEYVERYAKKLTDMLDEEASEEIVSVLDDYSTRFMEVVSHRNGNGRFYFFGVDDRERVGIIDGLIESCIRNLNLELPTRFLNKISEFQNRLCLCFDNVNDNNKNPVLFLSDITRVNYNRLSIINKLADYYCAVKVPHHGTKAYYINNLPNSVCLLIPNDNERKRWEIYDEYYKTYRMRCIITNERSCCACRLCCTRPGHYHDPQNVFNIITIN